MLAERGIYGLVWLDDDLTATARYGPLVERIEIGDPILDSLPLLAGYEPEFDAVRDHTKSAFTLPSVCIVSTDGPGPRINISAFLGEPTGFVILVTKVLAQSTSEVELSRQMRARLMAEEAVAQKSRELTIANAELELANRDLEDYAAVISHDLKAPLRALRYLTDDLDEAISEGDFARARKDLDKLRGQSRRMSNMMSALLDYASVGRKSDAVEDTDTHALIASIVDSIPRPVGMNVLISGRWLRIPTLAAPLDLVLRNLIDNAIKHHERTEGRIEITAEPTDASLVITVSDDGPGIPEKHRGAAFLPFRTLEAPSEPGASVGSHGMGLAFARRTAETAGGRLEIVDRPQSTRGTCFKLTWPLVATSPQARIHSPSD